MGQIVGGHVNVPEGAGNGGNAQAKFVVVVTKASVVTLEAEVHTPSKHSDSLYVWWDGKKSSKYAWHNGKDANGNRTPRGWLWKTPKKSWRLSAGQHTLHFGNREDGT